MIFTSQQHTDLCNQCINSGVFWDEIFGLARVVVLMITTLCQYVYNVYLGIPSIITLLALGPPMRGMGGHATRTIQLKRLYDKIELEHVCEEKLRETTK